VHFRARGEGGEGLLDAAGGTARADVGSALVEAALVRDTPGIAVSEDFPGGATREATGDGLLEAEGGAARATPVRAAADATRLRDAWPGKAVIEEALEDIPGGAARDATGEGLLEPGAELPFFHAVERLLQDLVDRAVAAVCSREDTVGTLVHTGTGELDLGLAVHGK